jgi:NAD(P) transhydrogenase subunit beta
MESSSALLILVACVIVALLVFAAVKLMRAHLSELRDIGINEDVKAVTAAAEPEVVAEKSDAARTLLEAQEIIVVPGFGMGVSRAQFQLAALAASLAEMGKSVRFAIHPAAGRMPGHMNILLDEAEVPHTAVFDLEHINGRFSACDLALIVGANDVVNPAAREDVNCPNYGMPVLDTDKARQVLAIKRGQGNGYSSINNPLFTRDNVRMIYGDAREILQNLLDEVKSHQDSPAGT